MLPEEVIVRPVVTEKSNDGLQEGKYTFEVNKKATKVEIAKAVEKLFGVKVFPNNWADILNSILGILIILGVIIDPSTPGINDNKGGQ